MKILRGKNSGAGKRLFSGFGKQLYKYRFLYFLLLPAIVLTLIFHYLPYWGLRIAFQNYNIFKPETSTWCGFDNFIKVFQTEGLIKSIGNTLYISLLSLIICFPANIIFALLLNEITNSTFKKIIQTTSYLPHFLSWISVIGIVTSLYASTGIINDIREFFGLPRIMLMAEQGLFVPNIIILTLWKGVGWGSIIYLAAIAGVPGDLYEAAELDGANRLQQAIHITLPSIMPTVVIMLIWRLGSLFGDNFELVYGLKNAYIDFDVISTIIFERGIQGGEYALTTAFGLANSVVALILILLSNAFAKKVTDVGIF